MLLTVLLDRRNWGCVGGIAVLVSLMLVTVVLVVWVEVIGDIGVGLWFW